MSYPDKPSKRFVMHGHLENGESYHPDLHTHTLGVSDNNEAIDVRNNSNNKPFYPQGQVEQWKKELKPARCSICMDNITNADIQENNCLACSNGHKFHSRHEGMQTFGSDGRCHECRNNRLFNSKSNYDIFSGGRQKRKQRKTKRRVNKRTKRRLQRSRTNKRR